MKREESKWFTQRPRCEGLGSFVSIGLKECRYAFAVLGLGVLFALSFFCGEYIMEKLFHKRKI